MSNISNRKLGRKILRNIFKDVENIGGDIKRVIDNFYGYNFPGGLESNNYTQDTDFINRIEEDENNFYLQVSTPGFSNEELNVEVVNRSLRISGEKKKKEAVNGRTVHFYRGDYDRFSEEFSLPSNLDADSVKVKYENGVLFLTIPKSADSKVRKISIESE